MTFPNSEGKRVPQVKFRTRQDGQWKDVTTDEIFKGKTVVVFSLPGAFTPTCSSTHVPRYNELAPVFKANGTAGMVMQYGGSLSALSRQLSPSGRFPGDGPVASQLMMGTGRQPCSQRWARAADTDSTDKVTPLPLHAGSRSGRRELQLPQLPGHEPAS